MEKILHKKWWDYSDQKFHLDGYICLRVSALWGVCSVLMIYFLNPFFCGLVNMIPRLIGEVILWVLLGLLIADGLGSGIAVLELKRKKGRIEQITEELQKTSKFLENALTKRIQKRLVKAFPNIETEKDAEQEEKFAEGCGFFKLASLFIIGAFIGDIVETIFCLITTGRLMSRSSLVFGQFSIVWGIACALLTWILYRYRDKSNWFIFLFGTILGGAYEYICSVFTEIAFGTVFWDYSKIPFVVLFLLGICRRYLDESGLPVFVKTDRTIAEKGGTYHLLLAACCSDGGYGAVICRFGALRRTSGRKRRKRDYR